MPPRASRSGIALALVLLVAACERGVPPREPVEPAEPPDEMAPPFRNVGERVAYVGDSACAGCHASEAAAYSGRSMAQSFHRWTPAVRVEGPLRAPIAHPRSGLRYTVVEDGGKLYQVELIDGPDGRRVHELRRRVDYVMGSGRIARSYFTEENGRLFQLPLTWYRRHGWDFSPGYQASNPRFSRELPDRCIGCHSSYPEPLPHIEGKYAALRPGIGCERCHGPGALHVRERAAKVPVRDSVDRTIVNPARLPLARRLDTCEQCHVHTAVAVPREGRGDFDYVPSQPLHAQWAFFKTAGGIDVVSHADRLRQSACFIQTMRSSRPLECATCHDPHREAPAEARNQPCLSCHLSGDLARRLPTGRDHARTADCVTCHMPPERERDIPHGTFTDHWIRVAGREPSRAAPRAGDAASIEPYYARDRAGPEAAVYQGMGAVVQATLASDRRALADAATRLRRALAGDLSHADAHFLLGVAYQQLGDASAAIPALERSLAARPDRPEAMRALARTYALAGRPAAEVAAQYERALALQPALAWMRAEYADLLYEQGEVERAAAAYRAAVAEQPSLAVAWFNLGTALVALGQTGDAAAAFRRALALDPVLDRALASLVRVRVRERAVLESAALASPVPATGVAALAPQPVRVGPGRVGAGAGIVFAPVPPQTIVRILRPDESVVRTLSVAAGGTLGWDLLGESGKPVGGGLYRARVLARDASGRQLPALTLPFGIVRVDER